MRKKRIADAEYIDLDGIESKVTKLLTEDFNLQGIKIARNKAANPRKYNFTLHFAPQLNPKLSVEGMIFIMEALDKQFFEVIFRVDPRTIKALERA